MKTVFMRRALQLATLGRGAVSPNPMVGCLIVHDASERILGEGWHQRYGEAHAERNAMQTIAPADVALLPASTAYVTLEPCSHYGKQPPCADLLIEKRIGRVICCNDDPNPLVAGRGFQKLREAGIPVETGVLAEEGRRLNARFFTFFEKKRPYIILKWAETADGFLGRAGGMPVQISGPLSQRLVHRWRAEEDAIMVGTNTARNENPRLNVRLWPSPDSMRANPVRIVIDRPLRLPAELNLFDNSQPTLVYNTLKTDVTGLTTYQQLDPTEALWPQLLTDLHRRSIQSVLVEGGAILLNSLLDASLWDEMRVFRAPMLLGTGVKAPSIRGQLISQERIGNDELIICQP